MKITPSQQRQFEAQIAELIRTNKLPTLGQVQTAIEKTRQEFSGRILAARAEEVRQ